MMTRSVKGDWKCLNCIGPSQIQSRSNESLQGKAITSLPIPTTTADDLFARFEMRMRVMQESMEKTVREAVRDEMKVQLEALDARVSTIENAIAAHETNHLELREKVVEIAKDVTELREGDFESRLLKLEDGHNIEPQPSTKIDNGVILEHAVSEMRERQKRASNLIFHRVAESMKNTPPARAHDDTDFVKEAMECFSVEFDQSVERVWRIGTYDSKRIRPIVVKMRDPSLVTKILNQSRSMNPRRYNLTQDRTKNERDYLTRMRSELDARAQAGENNLTIKYIQGRPRVVQKSSRSSTSAALPKND